MSTPDHWHAMYLGAFVALGVSNTEVASMLSELTKSTDEAVEAIHMLRNGQEGDRVWPVVEHLRRKRETHARK